MPFFDKVPEAVTEADLLWLQANHVQENDRLDYKREYAFNDDGKRELRRDIVALANHRGGRLLIGIDEDTDQAAGAIVGAPPHQTADWVRDVFLVNIEERIVGLRAVDVPLTVPAEDGTRRPGVVVLVDVPESQNAPHRVVNGDWSQFWRRHGRRRAVMSVDEIRDGFVRVLDTRGRIERFLQARRAELLERSGDRCTMVLSALPARFRGEEVLDIRDRFLRDLIQNPPSPQAGLRYTSGVRGGQPLPTLEGLQAEDRFDSRIEAWVEVHRNGYVEFAREVRPREQPVGLLLASVAHSEYLLAFGAFLAVLYGRLLPGSPALVRLAFYNAAGLGLTYGHGVDDRRRWQRPHLEVGEFLVEDPETERQWLPKRVCDRLWNAFGYDEANVFDADGNLVPSTR
jgi:hypothetical protein